MQFLNDAALELLGISSDDGVVGRSILDFVAPEHRDAVLERLKRVEDEGRTIETQEFRVLRPDGETLHVESRAIPIDFDGAISTLTTVQDITDARKAQRALDESEETRKRYRQLFEDSLDAVYVSSADGRILEMNPAGLEMFGYSESELENISAADLYADPSDRISFQRAMATRGSVAGYEVKLRRQNGEVLDALITATVYEANDESVGGYMGIIRDITERKEFEEQLEQRALHDPLTGLPNRALFWDRMEHAVGRSMRDGGAIAVLFVDLNRFKAVNDSLGHVAGDRLLASVADRLLTAVREPDTVARVGGDEFIVLLEQVAGPDDVRVVAERILESLRASFAVGGEDVHVTASIGVVLSRAGEASGAERRQWGEELVRRADRAMYRAKSQPGTQFCMYDPALDEEEWGVLHRETELRRGIESPEFVLHYQPIIRLDEGRIVAVEALARWDHPERGLLRPGEFLTLAEETGLIVPLGERLIDTACHRVAEWNRTIRRESQLFLHVNASPRQFEAPDFVRHLCETLERTGLPRELLEVEITEHLVINLHDRTRELRELGVGISVDDFGTGYSSLSYVKNLAADVLKIDHEFVHGIDTDIEDRAIVKMILSLADTLEFDVVAEGIETAVQLQRLRELDCGWGQGYYFARPLPADECERLLRDDPRW